MTKIIKENAPIILSEIKKAKNILLHCHPSPDPDSVGSALAMKLGLEQLGKKVTLIKGDSEIPKAFAFPGVETITQKNFFEIDINDFDLFIILDCGATRMISTKSQVTFPESLMTIVIDHHISNEGFGKINCVDSIYPATGQLLFDLFNEMGIKLTHDIALNLFIGMYTDTGGFQYSSTTPETLKVASELAVLAPDFTKTIFTMRNSNRKERLIFDGLALSSLKEYYNGKLALTSVTYKQLQNKNITPEDYTVSDTANLVKSVIGFEISASLLEPEPGIIKISFRTRDPEKYDVSKIAMALGGGGHIAAAGARLNMTIPEAIDKVVKTVKEIYNL